MISNSLPIFCNISLSRCERVCSAVDSRGSKHCHGSENRSKVCNVFLSSCGLLLGHLRHRTWGWAQLKSSPLKCWTKVNIFLIKNDTASCGLDSCPNRKGAHSRRYTCELAMLSALSALLYMSHVSGHRHGNSCCAASPPLIQTWMAPCRCCTVGKME